MRMILAAVMIVGICGAAHAFECTGNTTPGAGGKCGPIPTNPSLSIMPPGSQNNTFVGSPAEHYHNTAIGVQTGPAFLGVAQAQTPTELKDAAESVRPSLLTAMKPYLDEITIDQTVCIGVNACLMLTVGKRNTVVGSCSGSSLRAGNDNILVGDHTALPTPDTSGFVNIGNTLCFWRTTGERVACPPPEPECKP